MKVLRLLVALLALSTIGFFLGLWWTAPEPLDPESESASRLAPGPFEVATHDATWVDATRPTDSNEDFSGADDRTFRVTIWSPQNAPGAHPLLVYSHGFMSMRTGGSHLAEHMASHGYVIVATDFPLTNYSAPGGPNANDVLHQPDDVSFLIDQMLSLGPAERGFEGAIDRARIGLMGLSLGGLTTTLSAFHPRLADPRVRAAVSIAGPAAMFGPSYFATRELPFLMIAGTHDAMIQYGANAEPLPGMIRDGGLVTIETASHAGFSSMASGPMRLLGNPDTIGCDVLVENLDFVPGEDPFALLGGPEDGLVDASSTPFPCEISFESAMAAGRQQAFAILAVRSFFESHFARDEPTRSQNARFLMRTLAAENDEVRFTPASAPTAG